MDKYEVSKALWDEVASWAGTRGYDINTGSASGKATDHPVYNVTWHEAVKWSTRPGAAHPTLSLREIALRRKSFTGAGGPIGRRISLIRPRGSTGLGSSG
jgi:formylglycine-generating enzyme required for sulfatase activity